MFWLNQTAALTYSQWARKEWGTAWEKVYRQCEGNYTLDSQDLHQCLFCRLTFSLLSYKRFFFLTLDVIAGPDFHALWLWNCVGSNPPTHATTTQSHEMTCLLFSYQKCLHFLFKGDHTSSRYFYSLCRLVQKGFLQFPGTLCSLSVQINTAIILLHENTQYYRNFKIQVHIWDSL